MVLTLLIALATANATPAVHARTKALARQATSSYTAGRYASALAAFEKAYENEPLPSLFFDIAQCHRALGQWRLAAEFYRRYLERLPRSTNAEKVRSLLAEVEGKLPPASPSEAAPEPPPIPAPAPEPPAASPAPLPPPPLVEAVTPTVVAPTVAASPEPSGVPAAALATPAPEKPARSGPPTGALALVIGGGAVLAAGIVFGVLNLSINAQNHAVGRLNTISQSQAQLEDIAGTVALPANLVGGAALAGGLGWWLFAK